jgi:DNA-binding response OmpR family regulator
MNAVIVEDSKVIRHMIKQILLQLEIETIGEAEDGIAGLEMVLNLKPDLVMLDMHLPKLDGDEVVRWIKKTHIMTKICALSSFSEGEIEHLLDLGVDGAINKPLSLQKMVRFCYESGLKSI